MTKKSSIVWRLLRRNISPAQIAGYAIANLVGLAIVMTAIQLYHDVATSWGDSDDPLMTSDYLVLSRQVSGLGSLLGTGSVSMSESDIADLSSQPWAESVGLFTPSRFNVNAAVSMRGRGMSTAMFFESIPDEFFDVKPDGWGFDPSRPEIPIVLSRDYLALYNFGFAATQGLPQVSESMISMVPLNVSLSGAGRQMTLPARIVGFSSRLNTIAVPQSFMDWANARFADNPADNPSRVIVKVTDPGDPAIKDYLDANGLESAGDKLQSSRASHFFAVAATVVIAIGTVISVLAFFILMLSIYLLIQKSRTKIRDLTLLGYRPLTIAKSYMRLVTATNLAVWLGATVIVVVGQRLWSAPLAAMGATPTLPVTSTLIGLAAIAVITAINCATIMRLTRRSAA